MTDKLSQDAVDAALANADAVANDMLQEALQYENGVQMVRALYEALGRLMPTLDAHTVSEGL